MVAVVGVTPTRIPESTMIIAVPVFFASALAVAVRVMVCNGFCTRAGAVYVIVVSVVLESVPSAEVQAAGVLVVCLPVESVVVVVKVHFQVTEVSVAPETTAVKDWD